MQSGGLLVIATDYVRILPRFSSSLCGFPISSVFTKISPDKCDDVNGN